MASIPKILLDTLMELDDEELKTFQWHLHHHVLKGFSHIPKSKIKDKTREQTVDVLVQTFADEDAVTVTVDALLAMQFKQLSETLKQQYNNGKVDPKTGKGC